MFWLLKNSLFRLRVWSHSCLYRERIVWGSWFSGLHTITRVHFWWDSRSLWTTARCLVDCVKHFHFHRLFWLLLKIISVWLSGLGSWVFCGVVVVWTKIGSRNTRLERCMSFGSWCWPIIVVALRLVINIKNSTLIGRLLSWVTILPNRPFPCSSE